MTHALITDTLTNYKGRYYAGTAIKAMREWIESCTWLDLKSVDNLTNEQVLAGIDRTFDGGLIEFMQPGLYY